MTSSRPLAAGWRAARGWAGRGWPASRGPAQGGGAVTRHLQGGEALVAGAGHLGQGVDLDGDGGAGCAGAGRSGSRRPRAGRSRRSGSSGHGGAGSRPRAAGRRPCGSARPRPRPAWAAGRRPRRTGPTRRWCRGPRGARWRRRGRGSCRPPAQLPLGEPAATLGDAWLQGQADDADGVDVGELGDDEGPAATSRPTSRSALTVGATHWNPSSRSRAIRPRSSQRLRIWRRVCSLSCPATFGEPGDSRPSSTRRTSERAAYCWPSQYKAATSRSVMPASMSQRGRREAAIPGSGAARWCSVAGAVDPWAGSGATSPKEALVRHRGRPPLGGEPPLGVLARRPGGRGTQPRRRR